MTEIKSIDEKAKTVHFTDDSEITHKDFLTKFREYFTGRIAGETLIPADMENFMRRTSSKNLSLLMKGKKAEGYMEGSMDKLLTKGQKMTLVGVVTIILVVIFIFYIIRSMGLLEGF